MMKYKEEISILICRFGLLIFGFFIMLSVADHMKYLPDINVSGYLPYFFEIGLMFVVLDKGAEYLSQSIDGLKKLTIVKKLNKKIIKYFKSKGWYKKVTKK